MELIAAVLLAGPLGYFSRKLTCMDGFEALAAANAEFVRRLRLVVAGDWSRATACTEWDVRDLVNAVAAFVAGARTLLAEFRLPGALERQVHHPTGDRSGRELLGMRILDVTVHAWDLACGIDADRRLDRTLVQRTLLEQTGRRCPMPAARTTSA